MRRFERSHKKGIGVSLRAVILFLAAMLFALDVSAQSTISGKVVDTNGEEIISATVLVKGVCCGLVAGCVYKLIESKNTFLAVLAAAIVCPIVNTGIFVIGCRLFFFDTITAWATEAGAASAGAYIIFTLIGVNFLIEMAVNIVLSSVIVRIIGIGKKA